MSAKKFKFVSPGIFLNEVDQSILPRTPQAVGPVIIGRTKRGPAFRPTRIDSFSDYLEVFGEPVSGGGSEFDQWRDGVPQGPTYASYAAHAYLRNNGPVTVVRLLGSEHPQRESAGAAGYTVGTAGASACASQTAGGAFGLFVFPSGSANSYGEMIANSSEGPSHPVTGTLGAIFYLNNGSVELTGTVRGGDRTNFGTASTNIVNAINNVSGASVVIQADAGNTFRALFKTSTQNAADIGDQYSFNFDPDDDKYIRKVFNTNPTLTNSDVTVANSQKNFFLGQSYDRAVQQVLQQHASGTSGKLMGVILPLKDGTNSGNEYGMAARAAQSGWIISQDLRNTVGDKTESSNNAITFNPDSTDVTRLFKFHSLSEGEWEQRNLKISIERVSVPKNNFDSYGTFSVVLRKIEDNDRAQKIVERFDNLSLNPNSPDFISKRIGDQYEVWDDDRKRLQTFGSYANQSKFVRVEVGHDVETGQANAELLPFGFLGPLVYNDFRIVGSYETEGNGDDSNTSFVGVISGSNPFVKAGGAANTTAKVTNSAMTGSGLIQISPFIPNVDGTDNVAHVRGNFAALTLDANIKFPTHRLVADSSEFGLVDHRYAYFGMDTTKSGSSNTAFDKSNIDLAYPLSKDVGASFAPDSASKFGYAFTLDDVSGSSVGTDSTKASYDRFYYVSGSRAAGDSITAASGTYKAVLDAFEDVGGAKFTLPLFGGFDGFDITEKEPFNHQRQLTSTAEEKTSYAYYSVKKGIDMVADAEFAEMNLAAVPGITNENLTGHLIEVCEERGDALAIIDPKGGYTPNTEDTTSEQTRTSTTAAKDVADNMKARNINSSYGAAYFPWVQVRDSIKGNLLYVPPSVVGLGVLGASEAKSAVWFAPAGFNRGGLNEGAAGISVVGVRHKLTSGERDRLYENNINPIASFPAEGLVIFGQKTLQVTPSALDRINVRRLLIFVKKGMSRISSTTLFEQNIEATWQDFKARADSFLGSVKAGLGLEGYKVVLDSTTTTPDLVDRNVLYAKIFLKPARSIEFIALDFVITSAGASFED